MFGQLQNKFAKIFKSIKGHGKITESNIKDAIREIRIALLESDVNFQVVKNTLQSAVDHGWKKTKTVEQLRKYGHMTVRQAREIVKSEFESIRRWEDGEGESKTPA